jgi:hypothetical protein
LNAGDSIEIEGVSLKIARIMPEYGTLQDVQLVTHLEDAQQILGKPGNDQSDHGAELQVQRRTASR